MNDAGENADVESAAPDPTPMHYVCTLEEARQLVEASSAYWVSNCGCREEREGGCERSRIDVCLMFRDSDASGSHKREITRGEAEEILKEAESCRLVSRPFRSEDRSYVEGICFCCDDCCGYFVENDESCDKGSMIEQTDMSACTNCGICADVCYFHVREVRDGRLVLSREKCYGCGLCIEVCLEKCVALVGRC